MRLSKVIFIYILCLFCATPLKLAEAALLPPPVERVAPPVEKTKNGQNKAKYKRLKKKANRKKIKLDNSRRISQANYVEILYIAALLFPLLMLIGAFIFGFGILTAPIWITGAVILGLGAFFGLLIVSLAVPTGYRSSFSATFLWVMFFVSFLIGLVFLLWGIFLAGSVAWIMGIILLGLALLILSFFIVGRVYRNQLEEKRLNSFN